MNRQVNGPYNLEKCIDLISLERMVNAVERVREGLLRAAVALEAAEVRYAIIGGDAVAAWVTTTDESAVRNEPVIEILVAQGYLESAKAALENAGLSVGAGRNEVHLLSVPKIVEVQFIEGRKMLPLDALVAWCLERHKTVDKVYLRDLIEVGLVDEAWPTRYPKPLAERLQALLDDPLG